MITVKILNLFKKNNRKKTILYTLGFVFICTIIFQFIYSPNKLLPFTKIDGIDLGGQEKDRVTSELNKQYSSKKIELYAGDNSEVFSEPGLMEIGQIADNSERVNKAASYPWYVRIVPSSVLWFGLVKKSDPPKYQTNSETLEQYIDKTFGSDCRLNPKNPSAEASETKIKVTKGVNGGICQKDQVVKILSDIKPTLQDKTQAHLDVKPIYPAIETKQVEDLVNEIESRLKAGVGVAVNDEIISLEANQVRSWLVFSTDNDELKVLLNHEKANEILNDKFAAKLTRNPGVTKITTHDFTETSRVDGASGQSLDLDATGASLIRYLVGEADRPEAIAKTVAPKVEYTRTYSSSNEGLSALIKNYAADRPGKYGVSLIELSGQRRRAGYNENLPFTTASTYKVYVAYSVLKRIESSEMAWSNQISGGRDAAKCLDDMIVLSDNACAEAFVSKIGYTPLHRDVQSLGLKNTSFIDKESFKTTAADLSSFMAMLETRQLSLSNENTDRLINAMRRNVYRQGIPAGASGPVADKVGFLDGLLHDTAIVYSPSGTNVLAIMTDGSSWANIAELTRQIEKIRG